jgi:parvulin-like peptidyl-prolyl isomerase
MPSRVVNKPETLTRKQRRHLRRDQVQTRVVLAITAAIILVVAGVIGYGYLNTYYLRVKDPAAIVYGETITIGEVQKEVRYQRLQLVATYNRLILSSTSLLDATEASALSAKASLIASSLSDNTALGELSLQFLIDAKIARHEAETRGILVSDEEVQTAVNDMLDYIPAATLTAMPSPSQTLTFTPTSTHTLTPTVTMGGPTLTPTPTDTPTPTPTPTATIGGTVTATLTTTLTPTVTTVPTATPFTEQAYQKRYSLYLTDILHQTGITEAEFLERVRSELYIEKVRNAIMAEVPRTEEQVHLAKLVVADESAANAALVRLGRGESWDLLVKELSIDTATKDKNGDAGWVPMSDPPTDLEKAAFALQSGQVSKALQIGANSWVILKVLERGPQPMSADKYIAVQQTTYQEWLDGIRNNTEIVDKKGIPAEMIPTKPGIA